MNRKDQIEAFKAKRMKERSNGDQVMVATREEFLAYAFMRGRYYQEAERIARLDIREGPDRWSIARIIKSEFPVPDPMPVPVPVGPEDDELKEYTHPWPDVHYENIPNQVLDWLQQRAPDQNDWCDKQYDLRVKREQEKAAHRATFTPERIEELRTNKQ